MVNIPIVNAPYLSVDGLEIEIASTTTATVQDGRARNSTNENDIIMLAAVTLNAATTGINGLDTGALANGTLYSLYLVGDSTNNNDAGVVLSASATQPLMPVGYDMFRKIGYLRTDGSAHFLAGYWSGSSNERTFVYDVPIATAITAGNSATYAAVTLTTFVPAVQNVLVKIETDWTANAAADTLALQPFDAVGDTVKYIAGVAGATAHTLVREYVQAQLDSGAPKINYKVSAGTVAINVAGYQYTI
ncbi:MAG TPA: hypothetical protein VJ279_08460 [Hanamia sp.]|jgi:hypothetical protein|nr:hypothetical protein [Hanamia sp.]